MQNRLHYSTNIISLNLCSFLIYVLKFWGYITDEHVLSLMSETWYTRGDFKQRQIKFKISMGYSETNYELFLLTKTHDFNMGFLTSGASVVAYHEGHSLWHCPPIWVMTPGLVAVLLMELLSYMPKKSSRIWLNSFGPSVSLSVSFSPSLKWR